MIKLNQLIQEALIIQQSLAIQENRKAKVAREENNTVTIKKWIQESQANPITKNPLKEENDNNLSPNPSFF